MKHFSIKHYRFGYGLGRKHKLAPKIHFEKDGIFVYFLKFRGWVGW